MKDFRLDNLIRAVYARNEQSEKFLRGRGIVVSPGAPRFPVQGKQYQYSKDHFMNYYQMCTWRAPDGSNISRGEIPAEIKIQIKGLLASNLRPTIQQINFCTAHHAWSFDKHLQSI